VQVFSIFLVRLVYKNVLYYCKKGDLNMTEVIAPEQLRQYISRVERLESDRADITDDIKQVFDEAKANGFDTKIMKQVLKLKKLDKASLAEQEAVLDLYRAALDI
jgi:uncharacterized protein (UPF0335 family)